MILESEFICELEESNAADNVIVSEEDVAEKEELLHFLFSVEEEKKKDEAKLAEELKCLNEDIKELERNHSYMTNSAFSLAQLNYQHFQDSSNAAITKSIPMSFVDEARFMNNITQLENCYFSMRFQGLLKEASVVKSGDKSVMESRWRLPHLENVINNPKRVQGSTGCLGPFFEGLCKFARYNKFEERGTLRNRDLLSSSNVICALSFDRDEDYIAAGGISKKIKIFDLNAISSDSVDIQYPVVEMSNKSKLSCVCWNSYIKNHLASTDYDGVVQVCTFNTCNIIKTIFDDNQFCLCPFTSYTNQDIIDFYADFSLTLILCNMDGFRCGMQALVSHCLNTRSTKRELGPFTFRCPTQKRLPVEVMIALSNCGISARHASFYTY